jgi:hypothetical protein
MYADWHALGETSVFYRKWEAYSLDWKDSDGKPIDSNTHLICGSSLGGAIAVISNNSQANKFHIFTSSGRKLSEVSWDGKKFVGVGWNDQEQLVTVLEDGNVIMYNIFGKMVHTFLLLDASTTAHVVECQFWGNGVVAIASDFQLHIAEVRMTILPP